MRKWGDSLNDTIRPGQHKIQPRRWMIRVDIASQHEVFPHMRIFKRFLIGIVFWTIAAFPAWAQAPSGMEWTASAYDRFKISTNITYVIAGGVELKLDVYQPKDARGPVPVVIYTHGGGWTSTEYDEKVSFLLNLPYLQLGYALVNVQYRLAQAALAPAAVEDCRCALHWVVDHAKEYNFDPKRIILTGHSAGAHLALMMGMLPVSAAMDDECHADKDVPVAAIIDWFGITDVADLLSGPHRQDYAVAWIGARDHANEIAKKVSPLTYVRPGLPPILIIHGDADTIVPFEQATRLASALKAAGDQTELFRVPGGWHGGFSVDWQLLAWARVIAFLKDQGVSSSLYDGSRAPEQLH